MMPCKLNATSTVSSALEVVSAVYALSNLQL